MTVSDFKIRTNLENQNNSFRKTKSGPGVEMERKKGARENAYGGKSKSPKKKY